MSDNQFTSEWQWWAGGNDEWYSVGPCATREEATEKAVAKADRNECSTLVSVYVCEARQDPLRLADWVGLDYILERADENLCDSDRVGSKYDDGPWFECTKEQEADLIEALKRTCDEWQKRHGLKFTCQTFSHVRNQEFVVIDTDEENE